MYAFTKTSLANDFTRYGLDSKLDPNKDFHRETRIYRVLLLGLLDNYLHIHPDFSYEITQSEYGKKEKYILDYSLSVNHQEPSKKSKELFENFFQGLASFLLLHQDLIPKEYRASYDVYLSDCDKGAIQISKDSISYLSKEQYHTLHLPYSDKIGFPHAMDRYFDFVDKIQGHISDILTQGASK